MKPRGSRSPGGGPGSIVSREAERAPRGIFPVGKGLAGEQFDPHASGAGHRLQRLCGLWDVPRSIAYLSIRSTSARCSAASSVLSAWSSLRMGGVS